MTSTTHPPSVYRELLIDGDLAGLPYTHIAIYFELLDRGEQSLPDLVDTLPRDYPTIAAACQDLYDEGDGLLDRRADPDRPTGNIYRVADSG